LSEPLGPGDRLDPCRLMIVPPCLRSLLLDSPTDRSARSCDLPGHLPAGEQGEPRSDPEHPGTRTSSCRCAGRGASRSPDRSRGGSAAPPGRAS